MAETEIKVSPATIVAEETPALPNNTKNFFDLVWEANKLGLEGKRLVHISAGADFETGCQIYRLIHEDDGGELKCVACEHKELQEEREGGDQLTDRQSKLLTGVVNAIRGEPPELQLWSHHDAPELAAGIMAKNKRLREALEGLAERTGNDPCWCTDMDHAAGFGVDRHKDYCERARAALAAPPAAPAGSKPANTSAGGGAVPVLGGASLCPLCHSRRGESLVCQCCGNLLEGDKGVDDGTPIS